MDRPANEPLAGRHDDAAAAGLAAGGDRLVECRFAIGFAVTNSTIVRNLEVTSSELWWLDARHDGWDRSPAGYVVGRHNPRENVDQRNDDNRDVLLSGMIWSPRKRAVGQRCPVT